MLRWAATLKFVIPNGVYPDFLLRCTHQRPRVRLLVRKPHEVRQRHFAEQEIRGSVAEGPAVCVDGETEP
jgi:hypothetical protein